MPPTLTSVKSLASAVETAAVSGVCPWLYPPLVAAQWVPAVSGTVHLVMQVQQGFGFVVGSGVVVHCKRFVVVAGIVG